MCMICVDLAKGKLTTREAHRNLREAAESMDSEHFHEVLDKIQDKESEEESQQAQRRHRFKNPDFTGKTFPPGQY